MLFDKTELAAAGFRASQNLNDSLILRGFEEVIRAYHLSVVNRDTIMEADKETSPELYYSVCSLVFVWLLQKSEFATRTGGERKAFDNGEHLYQLQAAKSSAAFWFIEFQKTQNAKFEYTDICKIFFRNQILK